MTPELTQQTCRMEMRHRKRHTIFHEVSGPTAVSFLFSLMCIVTSEESDVPDTFRLTSSGISRNFSDGHQVNGDAHMLNNGMWNGAGYGQYWPNGSFISIDVLDPVLPDIRLPLPMTRPTRMRRISQPTEEQDQAGIDGEALVRLGILLRV